MWNPIYQRFLKPRSRSEDDRRREVILNTLLVAMITLSFSATLSAITDIRTQGVRYAGMATLPLFGVSCVFLYLYMLSRKNHFRIASYSFIGLLTIFATYPLTVWGILVPQSLLTYSLVIVMAGILLSSRAAFYVTGIIIGILFVITNFRYTNRITFHTEWMGHGGTYNDVLIFGVTFLILAVVAWLSNREIERSLQRARNSEQELRAERNSLEVKVRERTKELERIQLEKVQELSRFAEFGRVSSELLHELANPLTSMSLNIDQLENKQHSQLLSQVRESITFMEQYVNNARRQLRKQSDIRSFDSADELSRVIAFIHPKARTARIKIQSRLAKKAMLLGDSTRFSQVIANLLLNAIDAYEGSLETSKRLIIVNSKKIGRTLQISVTDHGKGIPKAEQKRIFEAFFSTKADDHGTGLGLTITKSTIEQDFQGKIEVMSTPKAGTTFIITLPLP